MRGKEFVEEQRMGKGRARSSDGMVREERRNVEGGESLLGSVERGSGEPTLPSI